MKLVNIGDNPNCQANSQEEFTDQRCPVWLHGRAGVGPRIRPLLMPFLALRSSIRRHGWIGAATRMAALATGRISGKPRESKHAPQEKTPPSESRILNLQAGEMVRVKSYEDILRTLDKNGTHHGLAFTFEMRDYCGQILRVFKRVERLYNEYTHVQRSVRNTVLLEGVYCKGAGFGCDRCCFHFWREAWLERAGDSEQGETHA